MKHLLKITSAVLVLLLCALGGVFLWRSGFFAALSSQQALQDYISQFAPYSHLCFFLLQFLSVLRSADGIYHENHSHTMLYVCSNYPRCDAYVRTHPGTNIPVGTLANHELRTLRNQAHHYFDQLYLSGLMSKQDAYLWLAGLLQVPLSKAHIGFLGEYYCNEVIAESKKLLERRRKQQPAGFRPCKGGEAS